MDRYRLIGKLAVPESNLLKWVRAFETMNTRVARNYVGDVEISTVFVGLNHAFGNGPPMIFETKVFDQKTGDDIETVHYSTWDEAEKGHAMIVEKYRFRE